MMSWTLSAAERQLFLQTLQSVCLSSRLTETTHFLQHGTTSVFRHCIAVAVVSCLLADRLHIRVDRRALVRGALLHDYFLYDWHKPDRSHRLHGFTHPRRAWENAMADFDLSPVEQNIILRHMFPLTLIPPVCREAWLICAADKYCSTLETLHLTKEGYGTLALTNPQAQNAS